MRSEHFSSKGPVGIAGEPHMAGALMEEAGGHVMAWNMTELWKLARSCG
jgi:hypothetical protein